MQVISGDSPDSSLCWQRVPLQCLQGHRPGCQPATPGVLPVPLARGSWREMCWLPAENNPLSLLHWRRQEGPARKRESKMWFRLFPVGEVQSATKVGENIWADIELIIKVFVVGTEYCGKGKGKLPWGPAIMRVCKEPQCRVTPVYLFGLSG